MRSEHGDQAGYLSYLVRLWRVPGGDEHTWRASLEEPRTQKTHSFKELTSLFAFLLDMTGQTEVPEWERHTSLDRSAGPG